MTSVLTAFRDKTERVAIAIAECNRLGIEVLGPDVRRSDLDFTVEGDSIRFGLLAIKNVGEGAIASIIEARRAGGEFTSLADLCARVDLRLVNKRVLEALIKVDALAYLGHPAQLLAGLDEAMAFGQAQARDRATGQGSLFDMLDAGTDSSLAGRLPAMTEAPLRERLRWEKELLGLYLSDHPLGELAQEMGTYVDTRTGDIGADLDQERVVVGGMAMGIRRVITRNGESMAVVTLEDMQGSVDVVIFPRTYADADVAAKLAEDAVLLVAGRVDHKGDETVVLADAVWTWDEATGMGVAAFGQAVAAGDRGRRGARRRGGNGAGPAGDTDPNGRADAVGSAPGPRYATVAIERAALAPEPETIVVPRVSPLRGSEPEGTITITIGAPPARRSQASAPDPFAGDDGPSFGPPPDFPPQEPLEPVTGTSQPRSFDGLADEGTDEPPLPEEVGAAVATAAGARTVPLAAGVEQVLHIRFAPAPDERLVASFEELKALIKSRPGDTAVVLHIPAGPGRTQEMRLGVGIAYDVELVSEVGRRFGGLLQLALA
jgi:hypothetical protein